MVAAADPVEGGEAGTYPDVLSLYAQDIYLDRPFYDVEGVTLQSEEACRVLVGPSPVGPCNDIEYAARIRVGPEAAGFSGDGGEARVS